ncbi:hypothetical protein ZWY2020_013526 [Hordeum vulgare]|uniref:Cold-induced small protein n=1 Tax=Hordeum vulgare TaxID=4513 RepID=A0A1W7GKT3_HORVU|nr:hypothetical protein ZWY2020_013526 [Hordeum vulgare]BAX25594.1 cold-induced small protein [Hordeum vulgare]
MGQCPSIRQPEAEYVRLMAAPGGKNRNEQTGKSTKAMTKYYKRSSKDDLVMRATLESITRIG